MCAALHGGHGGNYAARHCIANLLPRLQAWTAFIIITQLPFPLQSFKLDEAFVVIC